MTETQERRVVGLVAGSYIVNHTYLVTLAPVVGLATDDFGVSIAAVDLTISVQDGIATPLQLPFDYPSDA